MLLIDKKGNKIIQNCIICELDIKKVNQRIRMINSYEQSNREKNCIIHNKENENEKEMKDNCKIIINDELIPFLFYINLTKKVNIQFYIYLKKLLQKLIICSMDVHL